MRGIRERDPRVGFSLLVQEILQDGFGIDPDGFFPQDPIQQVHVAGVDAVAIVHHREVTDNFATDLEIVLSTPKSCISKLSNSHVQSNSYSIWRLGRPASRIPNFKIPNRRVVGVIAE